MKFLMAICLFWSYSAHALFSFIDTGDLVDPGVYTMGANFQNAGGEVDGGNLSVHMDTRSSDATQVRLNLGAGATDFFAGLQAKWVPIPDVDRQPAIGLQLGGLYANDGGDGDLNFLVRPFVSKALLFDGGEFSPYLAISSGVSVSDGDTTNPAFIHVGSSLKLQKTPKWNYYLELAGNLVDAYNFITISAQYNFDDWQFR